MDRKADPLPDDRAKLLDENEQLRTALESALDENMQLAEDRDRLRDRVVMMARELNPATSTFMQGADPSDPRLDLREFQQSQAEEELRVAFEELQVLAEELEVANTGLQRANEELEMRVEARTREILRTSEELSRSELRFRTLTEGMPQLVWRARDVGDWTWSSPQWRAFTGQSLEESLGMGWLEAFHPDDREAARAAWDEAHAQGGLVFEGRICQTADGRYRHFHTRASPVRAPDGQVLEWLGTSTDLDDILSLQARQTVLVGELQHRTRNLMAVMQAVMLRTIKGSQSLDEFRRQIEARMQALARVQGLLSRRDAGTRVAFDMLLREEVSAHVPLNAEGKGGQVSIEGPPDIPLQSAHVQTFGLALHELMTNAVKYGALSTPSGRLSIRWEERPTGRDGAPRLFVDWRESGVTNMPEPGAQPRGSGYGRELIERALPYQFGAKTRYVFTPDGVHCTIEVDIPERTEVLEKRHG
jgi:PAS domain S-box-containing protein